MVTSDGKAYRAKITRLRNVGGMLATVDVEYDASNGFNDNVEEYVELHRLTLDHNANTHAKAMESIRASTWAIMLERVSNDIGPRPFYTPRNRKPDKRKLYTYEQALRLSQAPPKKRQRGAGDTVKKEDSEAPKKRGRRDTTKDKNKGNKPSAGTKELAEKELLNKYPDLDLARYCPACKDQGRRFNHPYAGCNFRPGGCWHGLKGDELQQARDKFFNDLKAKRESAKAENRRAAKAKAKAKAKSKARRKKKRQEAAKAHQEDDQSSDELDDEWWYSKSRDTRELKTVTCEARSVTFSKHVTTITKEVTPESITFFVLDHDTKNSYGSITWQAHRPLRRCLMMLQLQHGDDTHDVCLKQGKRLVDANNSPQQAGIRPGQTARRYSLAKTYKSVSNHIFMTNKIIKK